MAQDVNQSETDVAALVRSALVARISQERFELWMPADCDWTWAEGALTLSFPTDFARQIAKRVLHDDLYRSLTQIVGPTAALVMDVRKQAGDDNDRKDGEHNVRKRHGSRPEVARQSVETVAASTEFTSLEHSPPMAPSSVVRRTASHSTDLYSHDDADSAARQTLRISRHAQSTQTSSDRNAKHNSLPHHSNFERGAVEVGKLERDEQTLAAPRSKIDYWSDFVPGQSSQLAWTTINLIANDPGRMTPALVHGPFGVGKSHMASALAQRLRTQRRQRRVLHITAEQFTNDFTEAIRGSGLPILRRKYRDVDTLILDDLQFLIGKKATINELRHTLDNLLKSGRQVVFFADRSPNELEALGSDFVGRLRGGLVSPLLPLDEETRFRILKRDLLSAGVAVSDDIVLQISARAIGDGRLLKGISKRLMAAAYINEDKLSWDQCWNSIYDLIQGTQPIVRLGDIERVVCEVFGLEPNSLQSDRKTRSVSQPRMLAMFLARKYTPAAYQEIGDFFGNRRHSTVISAEKTVGSWLEDNAKLQLARGSLAIREAMRHVEANLHVG